MTETGDEFAGTSERSTKHSPRVDEELEHEIQGMVRSGHSTRAEEWRDAEPVAEGDPDIDADPSGHARRRDAGRHGRRRRGRPRRAGPLAGPCGLPQHRARARRGRPRPPGAGRGRGRARAAARGRHLRADRRRRPRARLPDREPDRSPRTAAGQFPAASSSAISSAPRRRNSREPGKPFTIWRRSWTVSTRSWTSVPTFPSVSRTGRMSSSRWVTSCGSRSMRVISASTSRRVEGGGQPADRRRQGGQRGLVVAEQRLDPADQALRAGRPRRRRGPTSGRRASMASSALARVRATPSMASSALAWVAATAAMAASALRLGGDDALDRVVRLGLGGHDPVDGLVRPGPGRRPRRSIASSARSTTASTRVSSAPTRSRQFLHPADGRADPGDQGERVGDAVRTPLHGGEDVGGSRHRRQSHDGPRYARSRWPTIRLRPRASPVGVAARAARPAWCPRLHVPVSSGRRRRRTGQGRRREGVDTGGGTADAGRRGWPRRPRAHPPVRDGRAGAPSR